MNTKRVTIGVMKMRTNILGRKVAKIALSYKGCKTGDRKHRKLVDRFNKEHPNGQVASYSSYWCAIFWTACQLFAGMSHKDVPMGYNVPQLIEEAKKRGIWVESDKHKPRAGDGIIYDWQDDGRGDNKGGGDHIGIVFKVEDNTIHVIEGNTTKRDKNGRPVDTGVCAERELKVNGTYIRGFICPRYNAVLMNEHAIKYSYPLGTSKKKYSKRPNKAYRKAWKKYFPKRKMTIACHTAVMLFLRSCGYKTMPLSWKKIIKYLDKRCDRVKFDHHAKQLRKGDIMMYRRVDSKGKHYHIWVVVEVNGKLCMVEARQRKHCAPYQRSIKKALKHYNKTWVFRLKETR